jgi:hypothetical protein
MSGFSLSDFILNTRKEDLGNDEPFKKQLKPLNQRLLNVSDYFEQFQLPLAVETSASIQQEWMSPSSGPVEYKHVPISSQSLDVDRDTRLATVFIALKPQFSKTSVTGETRSVFIRDDIVIIASEKKAFYDDNPKHYFIACVEGVSVQKDFIKVTLATSHLGYFSESEPMWFMTKISSILSQNRVNLALNRQQEVPFQAILMGQKWIDGYPSSVYEQGKLKRMVC